MAEKKKYNSILISGRKDETLTYSKYIKDEESGESVKESLDKKVNVTDKLTTQQINDGAITNEKMAAGSVGNTNLQDGSVSNEKLEDGSITNEKLAENSITKDKLQDKTIGVEKLDNELRQTIAAATGLPEDLIETIQNVDDTLKDHQSQLDDKQSQIDDKQQQITANDEDISLLQTRSTQMEETIKSIAATGGASQATAVTYNNNKSKLTAINIQSAVDEVVEKTAIKDEEGMVVETPFHYIQNEEFIFAKVDAEDKLLFGIQWDGTPKFGKTSAVEDRLQLQVTLLAEKVATIIGDDDTTSAIDTLKELKNFFANIDNTQTLTSILANLNTTIGKVAIKDEAGEIQDSPFRVISNDEFLWAVVDSEDRVLFGIYRATGKPYFPLNEMYHVEQNEEFFVVWLDAEDKVVLGIRRDGQIIGEIHAVNALKKVISQLQSDVAALHEKVGTIDTNLKELLDVFSLQENPEYLAVEKDAEGKILSTTNNDGSHYIHNAKSETIPEEFSHIEDPEGRTEITTDSNGNILKYRDKDGYLNECVGIKVSKKEIERIASIFKKQNFRGYIDYSDEKFVEIPIPRSISKVNFVTSNGNLPTWKGENLNGIIEFWDNDGNYFKKDISNFNTQGDSSQAMPWKNYGFDFSDGSNIKFGNWIPCDSFHLKKYYLDCFRGQCIVAYRIAEQMYQTRTLDDRKPYQYLYKNDAIDNGNGIFEHDFYTGALCHPDGFPIKVYLNGKYKGIWVWALKKARDNYAMKKNDQKHILLDGRLGEAQLWGGSVDWTAFEIRNPKVKKDIEGNDYDGDNPKEPSSDYEEAKGYIERLSHAISDVNSQQDTESKKSKFKEYFKLNEIIDYFLFGNVFGDGDGFEKNWIWGTWDGNLWSPTYYDKDQIFGIVAWGENPYANPNTSQLLGTNENIPSGLCWALFKEDIKAEYKRLRDSGVFSVNNIIYELEKWIKSIGYNNLKDEIENICVDSNGVPQTPTYRPKNDKQGNPIVYSMFPHNGGFFNSVGRIRNWLESHFAYLDSTEVFDYK